MYGGMLTRQRAEYMNAGAYVFASVVLLGGFVSELSKEPKAGLVLLLIIFVNVRDLIAHLAGIDFKFALMWYDAQLGLVEFAVPLVQRLGTLFEFLGILLLLIQVGKGYSHWKLEKHAVRLLIAGPVLLLLGSIHNSCQIYERADGHVQILQLSVRIPFLIGCLLLLAGSVINSRDQMHQDYHGTDLLGGTCNLGLSRDLRQLRLPGGRQNERCKSIQEAAWRRPRQADEREGRPSSAPVGRSPAEEAASGGWSGGTSRTNSLLSPDLVYI